LADPAVELRQRVGLADAKCKVVGGGLVKARNGGDRRSQLIEAGAPVKMDSLCGNGPRKSVDRGDSRRGNCDGPEFGPSQRRGGRKQVRQS
jgi:hypothetical protein